MAYHLVVEASFCRISFRQRNNCTCTQSMSELRWKKKVRLNPIRHTGLFREGKPEAASLEFIFSTQPNRTNSRKRASKVRRNSSESRLSRSRVRHALNFKQSPPQFSGPRKCRPIRNDNGDPKDMDFYCLFFCFCCLVVGHGGKYKVAVSIFFNCLYWRDRKVKLLLNVC